MKESSNTSVMFIFNYWFYSPFVASIILLLISIRLCLGGGGTLSDMLNPPFILPVFIVALSAGFGVILHFIKRLFSLPSDSNVEKGKSSRKRERPGRIVSIDSFESMSQRKESNTMVSCHGGQRASREE